MRSNRVVLLAAPLLVSAYGILRLAGRADGAYGPGLDWQLAHLAGLAGMVLFVPLVLALARLLPRTPWRTGTVGVALVGLLCTMVQFGADIVEGLLAADKAEMRSLSQQFHDIPGVSLAFYDVGPQLFFLGLLTLTVMLAVARRSPWWSPVLMITGIVLPVATLDLMPLAGLLMLAALWPAGTAQGWTLRQSSSKAMLS
ncbi:hypothetical protein ACFOW4_04015 [Micromonospora sp. GCM10011542]|uniref:hypothetical protein n=1 Tax=Micromonospora sp. GCM10011542 TaxID=3317337 RepID=UPI0036125ACC